MIPNAPQAGYRPTNEWLRRPMDPIRYQKLIRISLIVMLVSLGLFGAYWPRHEAVRLGYQTEALRLEKEKLEFELQDYRLRLNELAGPERVERLAREQLGLGPPTEIVVFDVRPSSTTSSLASGAPSR